jgi:hypothetical protein
MISYLGDSKLVGPNRRMSIRVPLGNSLSGGDTSGWDANYPLVGANRFILDGRYPWVEAPVTPKMIGSAFLGKRAFSQPVLL